jgi:hypothetical protein
MITSPVHAGEYTVTPYVRYTWKDKLLALAILSILGVIVATFGEFVAVLVAMGSAAAYLYFQGRNGSREAALRQREKQIDNLRLQVEVARKAFAVAASGPDGVEVVEDLLQEYGIRALRTCAPLTIKISRGNWTMTWRT